MSGFGCSHVTLRVSDVAAAHTFYVQTLGLPLLQEHPQMFAVRAGDVRISVFPGGRKLAADGSEDGNTAILLRCENLEDTMERLKGLGVQFEGEVQTAPGFMKHIALVDPDNNLLFIGEYMRDPLAAV